MATPVLKWAGGKRQLLDELRARLPASFDRYHEPFFGGGALFFELEPTHATVNDTNPRLVNCYRQVRDHPDELIERLRTFQDPESRPDPDRAHADAENYYYQARELFNRRPRNQEYDELDEAALLVYLNRTCYNGLYRENNDGEFNVPIGRYANPDWVRSDEIRAASRALSGVTLTNMDFEYVKAEARPGDVVYFDPPYEPMSPTASFTEYSAAGFDADDQTRLAKVAADLAARGVHVLLSNSGVTADMYRERGFHVDLVDATRAINSDPDNRDAVDEVVVTSVSPEDRRGHPQTTVEDY